MFKLITMTIEHHDSLLDLFRVTPGVTLREADNRESTAQYLARNPGLSFVAMDKHELIGCVMSGHDGRRAYLQHLVVKPAYRRQGVGEALVVACLDALEAIGIAKTHLFAFKTNGVANQFWTNKGWVLREDVNMYSFNRSDNDNV